MNILTILIHPEPDSFNGSIAKGVQELLLKQGHGVEFMDLYGLGFDPVEKADHYLHPLDDKIFSPLAEQRHGFKCGSLPADVMKQIEALEQAELVIFQFPIWWHSVPAMLKGWMDRVFISGGLYTSKMRYDQGYFKGKTALCSVTTGAPEESFGENLRGGEISQILWSTQYSLYYMGFRVLSPNVIYGVQGHGYEYSDDNENKMRLNKETQKFFKRLEHIQKEEEMQFAGWKDW